MSESVPVSLNLVNDLNFCNGFLLNFVTDFWLIGETAGLPDRRTGPIARALAAACGEYAFRSCVVGRLMTSVVRARAAVAAN